MANVRVTITGLDKNFVRRQIESVKTLAESQVKQLADETVNVMRRNIAERIERAGSTGNLENSITAIPIENGWGVGDIEFLNKQAPYWYWQNFGVAQSGRKVPPRSKGQFEPGTPQPTVGENGSRWYQSNSGGFLINPQKEIEAKNYIEATINEINQIIASVIRRT